MNISVVSLGISASTDTYQGPMCCGVFGPCRAESHPRRVAAFRAASPLFFFSQLVGDTPHLRIGSSSVSTRLNVRPMVGVTAVCMWMAYNQRTHPTARAPAAPLRAYRYTIAGGSASKVRSVETAHLLPGWHSQFVG